MKKGFRITKLISDQFHLQKSLHRTSHHLDSPLLSRLRSSSSYTNRSNDGYAGGRPPPRRRSGDEYTTSNRNPSSSRLSGFINDNDGTGGSENRGRGRGGGGGGGRRDFDNDSKYKSRNRVSDKGKFEGKNSYVPFHDDEENPQFDNVNPSRRINDNKLPDVDGFLDRFKLGFDQETKLNSSRATGEDEVRAEEPPAPPPSPPPPPEEADEIFRKMKETGLIPNAVSMLHGLCNDGLVQDALKLFGEMRERGSIPEVVIYTAVVEGFCKAQKPDEGIRIFRKMQSNGIVPNAFSYGVLVQGLIKGKRLDDAVEFSLEMLESGHSVNLATFTGLVNAFCTERGLESAQVVISKLKDKGFGFDEKSVRDFMEKKGPFSPMVWEAIFGKKGSRMF